VLGGCLCESSSFVAGPEGAPFCAVRRLLQAAQDICQEFLAKATGTAVEWIQLPLLKSGAESLGITSIAQGPRGVAARVCGLVSLPAPRVSGRWVGKKQFLVPGLPMEASR
jgi:hypothetical protein